MHHHLRLTTPLSSPVFKAIARAVKEEKDKPKGFAGIEIDYYGLLKSAISDWEDENPI